MELDTVKFFHEKGKAVSKIIDVAPKSLSPEQIQIAADRVHKKIKDGLEYEESSLSLLVIKEAKEVKAEEFLQEQEILADVNDVIKRIRKEKDDEISTLKNTVYEIDKYYQNHLESINVQLQKISKAIDKLRAKEDLNELWLHIVESISPATD